MDTTPEKATQIIVLIKNRDNDRFVARRLNMTRAVALKKHNRYQETGCFNRRPKRSRKP